MTEKSSIKNTTAEMANDPAEALLALAVSSGPGGPGRYIEETERAGQSQLVNSDRLPTTVDSDGGDEPFIALGFTFGPPDNGDALFRKATLPPGWKREGSDHAMWSHLVDTLGRRRVAIFYKAAFYDRDAFMSLQTRHAYLSSVLYDGVKPVLDDEWLTLELCREELGRIAAKHHEHAIEADGLAVGARGGDTYWPTRAAEHRAEAAKAQALAESLS
jgi:hypothetical protein